MHFGATLRLLRTDSGLSLRELAQRVGVSSAYLSRVENGHDAPPTPDRLVAIARALRLPPEALFDLGGRVSTFVSRYLEEVPTANALFVEIARRHLTAGEIARLRALLIQEFPREGLSEASAPTLGHALAPERVILGLGGATMEDAVELSAMRLSTAGGMSAREMAAQMLRRESTASAFVGRGVAVPHLLVPGPCRPSAALLTLADPIRARTPDGEPLRLVVAFVTERSPPLVSQLLLDAVALARQEIVDRLCQSRTAQEAIDVVRHYEQLRGAGRETGAGG